MIPVEVIVRAQDCPCPGTPHTEEIVRLMPEASIPLAMQTYKAMQLAEQNTPSMYAAIVGAYIPASIVSWTFVERDTEGDIVPVKITREAAERLIPWDRGGYEVADKADGLYSKRVTAPLEARRPKPLETGPTEASTSPNPETGSEPPKPSKPSLLASSAGKP